MCLSDCSSCKYLDRTPHHSGDIICSVNPDYASVWRCIKSLDESTLNCVPIDECRDFERDPSFEIKEIAFSLSFSQWQEFKRLASNTIVDRQVENCQINLNLALSKQIWQHISNSCRDPHVLSQLQAQGFEPINPTTSDTFEWIEVDSSCISAIAYDAVDTTLKIRFDSGCVYQYESFPLNQFTQFRDAHSKGRFFNHRIKHHYAYIMI